jgi:hypothetical protein
MERLRILRVTRGTGGLRNSVELFYVETVIASLRDHAVVANHLQPLAARTSFPRHSSQRNTSHIVITW